MVVDFTESVKANTKLYENILTINQMTANKKIDAEIHPLFGFSKRNTPFICNHTAKLENDP